MEVGKAPHVVEGGWTALQVATERVWAWGREGCRWGPEKAWGRPAGGKEHSD